MVINGNQSKEKRAETMKLFKEPRDEHDNTIIVLCNVNIVKEGIDIPDLDAICFMDSKGSFI